MVSMERLARFGISLVGASVMTVAGVVLLARLHAHAGWYYALVIALAGLVVLRTLAPSAGISSTPFRRRGTTGRDVHQAPTARQ
jgi:hypothetical protein